jgi:hypothetical protein
MTTLNHVEALESVIAPGVFLDFVRGFINGILGR